MLGTVGMGINAILTSAMGMIIAVANLGLNYSAVRDISRAVELQNSDHIARSVKVFKRWILVCAIGGVLFTLIGAPWLSQLSFGNNDYTYAFVGLAAVIAFTILASANLTILQGMRHLRQMAKASLMGSVLGLCTSIPLYYFFNLNGIVPALILAAIIAFIINRIYVQRLHIPDIRLDRKEVYEQGKPMVKLGIVMTANGLISAAVIYIINTYIGHFGSVADVGLYGAGIAITNQYIGIVFTAMGVDYFPRLSAICHDSHKMQAMVTQQAEMVILIVTPLLIAMIISAPILIRILLSAEFLVIQKFIVISAFGILFKAASYALGYISFAKGDKKTFFLLEGIFGGILTLAYNVLGYRLGGLNGMAIGIVFGYLAYFIIIVYLTHRLYGFRLEKIFVSLFIRLMGLTLAAIVCALFLPAIWNYAVGGILLGIAVWYSYKELDRRMSIKSLIRDKFGKNKL